MTDETDETAFSERVAERVMQLVLGPQLEQALAILMRPYLETIRLDDIRAKLENMIAEASDQIRETRDQLRELTELVKARDEADRTTVPGQEPPRRQQ